MAHDLIAILPHLPAALPEGLMAVRGDHATAVLAPAPGWAERLAGGAKQAAVRHHARLEALMALGPVLPFGAGASCTAEEAAQMLALDADLITRLAAEIGARRHFQLTVEWDAPRVLEKFRDSPELAPLFTGAPVRPEALRAGVEALAARLRSIAMGVLAPVVEEPLEQPRAEDSLLNLVFLLSPTAEPQLEAALEAIDALWTEGLRLRLVGPSAPISHALLDIDRTDAAALAKAADLLGVTPEAAPQSIQNATKTALRAPDLAANEAEAIRAAAQLLIRAQRAAELGPPTGGALARLVHLRPGAASAARPTQEQAA